MQINGDIFQMVDGKVTVALILINIFIVKYELGGMTPDFRHVVISIGLSGLDKMAAIYINYVPI